MTPWPLRLLRRSHPLMATFFMLAGAIAAPFPVEAQAAAWEPTGLAERTTRLVAPASGALFAATESATLRSDDAGVSWRPVPVPPAFADEPGASKSIVVDPANHARMFSRGWVTHDDGVTWSQLGSWPAQSGEGARLVPSAADPSLLYLVLTRGGMGVGSARFLRSRDAGETWEPTLELGPGDFRPSAVIDVTLFEAHPTDPNVMFQSVVGFTGRDNQGVLRRSADQGSTLQEVLFKPVRVPKVLVGGRGVMPGRFYCPLSTDLFRSDDDGLNWNRIGGVDEEGSYISDLDYDPSNPDRVYMVVKESSIQRSDDGGQTWTDLGLAGQQVNDLALGIDGKNLYAATGRGVFRLPVR